MKFTFVLAALACLALPAAAEPFRLIVTDLETPLVPNSVMDLALMGGYFERAGVQVELVRVQQTPLAIAALQAGEGEMANVAVDALLQLSVRGSGDFRAVMSPNKSLPFQIVARDGLATPADLAGKSFGVGRLGSLDHSLSLKVLEASGLDPSTLEIVALGQPAVRAQALLAGQVDATTLSIGTLLSLPEAERPNVVIGADAYYAVAPVVSKVNVVSVTTLQNRRAEVEAVIEALVLASRDFSSDPASWVGMMAQARPDIARADLEVLAKAYAQSWSVNGGLQRAELQFTAEWLGRTEDFKDLPPVPMDRWVDFAPLDAVLGRVGIAAGMDGLSR